MKYLDNILKFGRATHTCKVWLWVLDCCLPHKKVVMTTEEAEHVLANMYPNKGSSCLKDNEIVPHPDYDLQIIVPVYNAEKYLEECINSIINQQTKYSFHTVFINDGSTDGSSEILQKYASNPYVTVLEQDNKGVSAARNNALKHINAHYIMFVDADDSLKQGAIEELLEKAYECNSDVVEGSIEKLVEGKISYFVEHTEADEAKDLTGYNTAKVFNAQLFKKVGYPEGYRYEDTILSFLLYPMSKKMSTINDSVYLYRQHEDSFTSGEMKNYATLDAYWVVRQLLKDIQELNHPFDNKLYESFLLGMKLSGPRMNSLDDKTSKAYFAAMSNLANTLFKECKASGKLVIIDKALRNHDFTKYMIGSYFI